LKATRHFVADSPGFALKVVAWSVPVTPIAFFLELAETVRRTTPFSRDDADLLGGQAALEHVALRFEVKLGQVDFPPDICFLLDCGTPNGSAESRKSQVMIS
jgi:hypothetical protein